MSKRAGIFEQGRREEEYDELNARPGDGIDPVKRASAQQMAGRKIKAPKSRLNQSTSSFAGGAPSAPSNPFGGATNFSATAPTAFNFSAQPSAPSASGFGSSANTSSNFMFGNSNPAAPSSTPFAFGSSNAAPSNTPASPAAFGTQQQNPGTPSFGNNAPSTGFNFGATTPSASSSTTPFAFGAQQSTPSAGGFGSGATSTFGSGAASQTSAAGTSSNLFNFQATPSTPSAGALSGKRRLPNKRAGSPARSVAPSSAGNAFGNTSFGTFGADGAGSGTPASLNLFATSSFPSFGNNAAGSGVTASPAAPVSSSFPPFGAEKSEQTPAQSTPSKPIFTFGSGNTTSTPAAPQSDATPKATFVFGAQASTATTPSSNLFSQSLQPNLDSGEGQKSAAAPASNLFSSSMPQPGGIGTQPKSSPFQFGLKQAESSEKTDFNKTNEAATPAKAPTFSFGQAQATVTPGNNTAQSQVEAQPKPQEQAPTPTKAPTFSFGQSQPAPGLSSTAAQSQSGEQVKSTETSVAGSAENTLFGAPAKSAAPSAPSPAPMQSQSNPFGFPAPKPTASNFQAPTPQTADKASTSQAEEPESSATPVWNIPKAYVPPTWTNSKPSAAGVPHPSQFTDLEIKLRDLVAELATLNRKFKEKLTIAPVQADWTALSRWHLKESKVIMGSIVEAKKDQARLKGVTGNESSLSTKRKADEPPAQEPQPSTPAKKARPDDASKASFTPKTAPPAQQSAPFGSTPSATAPTQSSNPFANLSRSTNSAPPQKSSQPTASALFPPTPKTDAPAVTETNKKKAQASPSPFGWKPPTAATTAGKDAPSSGFKMPSFGSATSGSSMINAFAKNAKTAEQLKAERKAKAKDEDYDSDEETEEQWSARWDREEAAREAEEAKKIQNSKSFTAAGLGASGASGTSSPFNLSKPASTSTSLFASGGTSPGGPPSVFSTPSAAPSPGSNIFGHLSSAASSNDQDDTDEEDEEHDEGTEEQGGEYQSETPKPDESQNASDTEEEGAATPKPSLLSRVSFTPAAGNADNSKTGDENIASKTNGSFETPQKKFNFFDFSTAAGAKSAPSKSTFAGDQTFKPGTPIKFGTPTPEVSSDSAKPIFNFKSATPPAEPTASKPIFSFQAASPSSSDAGAKPAPFSFLGNSASTANKPSWLAPNSNQSGPASGASSVFSSRAATPLSDAGASEKDSTAGNAGDDDEDTTKAPQLDLSVLTEEEEKDYEVLFQAPQAIAKQQAGEPKAWKNFARGPLWILKNKETGKVLVRMRIPSGATPVNFNILPKLTATVAGNSKTMILIYRPQAEGKIDSIYIVVKTKEQAEEFSDVYNKNLPG